MSTPEHPPGSTRNHDVENFFAVDPATIMKVVQAGVAIYSFFSKSDDDERRIVGKLDAIQSYLAVIDSKLDAVLRQNKAILSRLEELPHEIEKKIRENELSIAYNRFRTIRQLIENATEDEFKISFDTLQSVLESWNIAIIWETDLERILALPFHAETLLILTRNTLHPQIVEGLEAKLEQMNAWIEIKEDSVSELLSEIEKRSKRPQIARFTWFNESPWIQFSVHGNRNKTIKAKRKVSYDCGRHGERQCFRDEEYDKTVPDQAWNTKASNLRKSLPRLRKRLSKELEALRFAHDARATLTEYFDAMATDRPSEDLELLPNK